MQTLPIDDSGDAPFELAFASAILPTTILVSVQNSRAHITSNGIASLAIIQAVVTEAATHLGKSLNFSCDVAEDGDKHELQALLGY